MPSSRRGAAACAQRRMEARARRGTRSRRSRRQRASGVGRQLEHARRAPRARRRHPPCPTDDRKRDLTPLTDRSAEHVVDDPREREPGHRERDRRPVGEVGGVGIDQPHAGVEVVEDDHQREPGEPGRVRLPLEPVQRLGHLGGREAVLLRVVEAAAVDAPELAGDARVGVLASSSAGAARGRAGRSRRTRRSTRSPRSRGASAGGRRGRLSGTGPRSLAIATSSPQPVSSSSSRVFADPVAEHLEDLRFGRPSTKTTNRKPNFSS